MLTDEHVLCAYADGSDLHDAAPLLRSRLGALLAGRRWATDQVVLVDQMHAPDPEHPDCLPDWDLGVNIGLDHIRRSAAWFADVEALVECLVALHEESARDFAVFLAFRSRTWLQEHLAFIGGKPVDLPWLRKVIEKLA